MVAVAAGAGPVSSACAAGAARRTESPRTAAPPIAMRRYKKTVPFHERSSRPQDAGLVGPATACNGDRDLSLVVSGGRGTRHDRQAAPMAHDGVLEWPGRTRPGPVVA